MWRWLPRPAPRRGEPLAWLTGSVRFCGETVLVAPGVYVPRPQSEALARAAVARLLPDDGVDGTAYLVRTADAAARLLRPAGSLLVEIGGDQAGLLEPLLTELDYREIELLTDAEGDPRALCCRRSADGAE